ncbi:MAG: GntR family transcriptional regulator [Acidimicrobiaceae bacterium]|nr:GntR family transcriptional regulator [Acidimicrobiaceae bacterium]
MKDPISLDRDSPIPLYFQIAQQIEAAIEGGDLKPGETISSEFELAELLGVSRPTIRQAIQQLFLKGYVVRRRGIGTVVIHRRIHRSASTSSFFDALVASGRTPRTEVLSLTVEPAPNDVARALLLSNGTLVLSVTRIRYADDEPIALMMNHIPTDIFDSVPTKAQLEGESLYSLIRRHGIELDYANQEIAARVATPKESNALKSTRGATLLTMSRTAYDTTGRAIELGRHVYLADRYSFEMTLPIH